MKGKDNKHVTAFQSTKLKPNEKIECHLEGWIGEMMGKGDNAQHNGQFILTNERACFYRRGILGEVFESMPLNKITSIETLSRMGYRVIRLHTSHDELAFKTFEAKDDFDRVYDRLEEIRHGNSATPHQAAVAVDPIEQLRKLKDLVDAGVISPEEFGAKKAELLARL
jgi:hypothetical protein